MAINPLGYLGAFDLLERDVQKALEYVHPIDANASTYSHRLYELLLRACTEFESVCKEQLVDTGYSTAPNNMTVYDYKTLETSLLLETREVGLLLWQPNPRYVTPFANWSTSHPPLPWYKSYNQVKHNRLSAFAEASLENVCLALAGLFALLVAVGVVEHGGHIGITRRGTRGNRESELVFGGRLFTLIVRPGE